MRLTLDQHVIMTKIHIGLSDCYGEEFEELYTKYESEGKFRKQIPAQKLWYAILESQIETGEMIFCYNKYLNVAHEMFQTLSYFATMKKDIHYLR